MLTRTDVGEVLRLANTALCDDTSDDYFVTLLAARLQLAPPALMYASAGHPPGYIMSRDGYVKRELWSTGMPLAVEPAGTFAAEPVPLEQGDVVLLVTDGIAEASSADGNRFGTERLLDALRGHRHLGAREMIDAIYSAVRVFAGDAPGDDITAVVIKVA
jgi:serine phosphatase RsbU (regulator of sigma subunit)